MFFIPFFLAGAALLYFLTIQPLWGSFRARGWTETPCTILESWLEAKSSKGTTYQVAVVYTYRFEGREYRSDRYTFFTGGTIGRESKAAAVQKYPGGSTRVCYVNPAAPSEAVLERGPTSDIWLGLFALLFLAVGIWGLVHAPQLAGNRTHRDGPVVQTGRGSQMAGSVRSFGKGDPGRPLELRPKTSPRAKFFGTVLFAIFWNGIVSIFVTIAIESFQRRNPEWFLTIFMVPFVLIGLGGVGMAFYYFLALWNPRPHLTVQSDRVPLGGDLDVEWKIEGRVERVRELRITLVGQEEATYRRGTDTRTDRNEFLKLPLVESTDTAAIRSGSTRFTIPENLIHSFDAPNNKIVWSLRVHGDIPRFPNIDEEFPLTVLPLPLRS